MKKILAVILATAVLSVFPIFAYADEQPSLESISFKYAHINGEFSSDVYTYELSLDNAEMSPKLESYQINGTADIFVKYVTDSTGNETGIDVTLEYSGGTVIYSFNYTGVSPASDSSDCNLKAVSCKTGELSPEFSSDETEYTLYVPSDMTELLITPTPEDENAYSSVITMTLTAEQEPSVTLTCTAADGTKKEYVLDVKRTDITLAEAKNNFEKTGSYGLAKSGEATTHPELFVALVCAAAGVLIVFILYKLTRRKLIAFHYEEKPFYKTKD